MLTAEQLSLLLLVYTDRNIGANAIDDFDIQCLERLGLLVRPTPVDCEVTNKGICFLEHCLAQPMPIAKWEMPK